MTAFAYLGSKMNIGFVLACLICVSVEEASGFKFNRHRMITQLSKAGTKMIPKMSLAESPAALMVATTMKSHGIRGADALLGMISRRSGAATPGPQRASAGKHALLNGARPAHLGSSQNDPAEKACDETRLELEDLVEAGTATGRDARSLMYTLQKCVLDGKMQVVSLRAGDLANSQQAEEQA